MAKVNFKDNQSLQDAKSKDQGAVIYRQMKDGKVVVAKVPVKRRKSKNIIKVKK